MACGLRHRTHVLRGCPRKGGRALRGFGLRCRSYAYSIDCAFTEAFNRSSPELATDGRSPMLNGSNESVRGQRANIAVTATVAHSATQGLIHALGLFIDTGLPQPRNFSATLHQAWCRL